MIGEGGVFDLLRHGGIVMAPLLLCSVVSVAVIVERLWALSSAARRSHRFQRAATEAWHEGGMSEVVAVTRRDDSLLGAVDRAVLALADADDETRLHVASRQVSGATRSLKRYVWLLGTIGSLAPFIGLLGTVVGIIRAFENMAATGSGGFAVVAAGISEALVATAAGLLVGVLAIFAYNAFMVRIGNEGADLREWTDELLLRLRTADRTAAPASPRSYGSASSH
jgi:biopolymer transport protein ExbB